MKYWLQKVEILSKEWFRKLQGWFRGDSGVTPELLKKFSYTVKIVKGGFRNGLCMFKNYLHISLVLFQNN